MIADSGPLAARLQSFGPFAPTVLSPWWITTTWALTPSRCSSVEDRLIAAASSPNERPWMPSGETIVGRSLRVAPMMPTFTPPTPLIVNGSVAGSPLS